MIQCLELLLKSFRLLDPIKYVGRSREQVDEYLADVIKPILDDNSDILGLTAQINV